MVDQLILFGERAKKKAQNSQNAALSRFFFAEKVFFEALNQLNLNCQDLSGLS